MWTRWKSIGVARLYYISSNKQEMVIKCRSKHLKLFPAEENKQDFIHFKFSVI